MTQNKTSFQPIETEVINETNINELNPKKAVALLSGGLDSTLATKLIKDMGFEVVALNFHTAFCTCNQEGCKLESRKVANQFEIPLKVLTVTKEFMEIVRNPKYGYGSAMNPCIDCRIFMFKKAKEYMEEINASFIVTGEVLGQRPMSQTSNKLSLIEKRSGLEGKILRPLTANRFKGGTEELQELIDFNQLPNITGRSRKDQIALAKELGIDTFLCAGGGCLLTDKQFAVRLKDYFDHNETEDIHQVKLLRVGRHFRISPNAKVIVGRDEKENQRIYFYKRNGIILQPESKGPTAIVMGKDISMNEIELAGKITAKYCSDQLVNINLEGNYTDFTIGNISNSFQIQRFEADDLKPYWVK